MDELVKFDGVVIRDGVRGGSDVALYCIWKYYGYDFDEEIPNSINVGRWLQIKWVIKLFNNKDAPKLGETNYNPAYNFYSSTRLFSITSMPSQNGLTWINEVTRIHGDMVDLAKKELAEQAASQENLA